MGWIFIFLAAAFEIIGVIFLRLYSQQKTICNLIGYIAGFAASFAFLYVSLDYLQLSIAYVVWVGIGTVGAVAVNILFFGEKKSPLRIASMAAVIIGLLGLKAMS